MPKKFYITTSIPYANAAPHIGHILDPIIADVLARYRRIKGEEVKFLVGSDEHGAKIVRAAEAQNKTPQRLVDENSAEFRALRGVLNLSWDDFIRTSDKKRHWPGAQKMWRQLAASGDIYRKKYRGLYCVGHEAFITEKDLVNGVCSDHQKEPEVVEEENWFFRLSRYSKDIESKIKNNELKILPESRKNEILSLIKGGLEDISFSRPSKDLPWGVPVPDDPSQTMYVWCDALVNYISAIGYGHDDAESRKSFDKWWPANAQVIGKDNLRFHAAIWPGMLLSAKLKLPQIVFTHGFINVEGRKISKTVGNVIRPEEIVKKYGTDSVRYYFLREFPAAEDGDFSYEKFEERYNGDLANGLGNFVSRILALGSQFADFKAEKPEEEVRKNISIAESAVEEKISAFKLNEALIAIWELIQFGDKYLNDKKPWDKSIGEVHKKVSIYNSLAILRAAAILLKPFLPETAEKILSCIEFDSSGNYKVKKIGAALFPRLDKGNQ